MAIMETKTIQVPNDPQVINVANEVWGRWGWNVLNLQVTHTQNTKTYSTDWQILEAELGGRNIATVETTTFNYATITYQRDKSIPGYERILELEQEYEMVPSKVRELYENKRKVLYNIQLENPVDFEFGFEHVMRAMVLLCFGFIPGIIYIFYKYDQYSKSKSPENLQLIEDHQELNRRKNELSQEMDRAIDEERNRILNEANMLLCAARK